MARCKPNISPHVRMTSEAMSNLQVWRSRVHKGAGLADLQTVGKSTAAQHLADRIGEPGDLAQSRGDAVKKLENYGIASACHMLIADGQTGGVGVEWSSVDSQHCDMNAKGQVFHSNHYLCEHPKSGQDTVWLGDSPFRVKRIEELAGRIEGEVTKENVFEMFKDEKNLPAAICRKQVEGE